MLAVAVIGTTPVFWWNWQHHWVSAGQLATRGHLDGPLDLHLDTLLNFIGLQLLVISPWLWLALLVAALITAIRWSRHQLRNEGEILLFLLFLPVFLMYAALAFHLREEPNWPAVSYLTLIVILASQWRKMLMIRRASQPFMILAFGFAWLQTLLMHDTSLLPLPQKLDPMGRVTGWSQIAGHLAALKKDQHADVVIADAYKEASIFSFHLPEKAFIYTLRNARPSNQYDFWPGFADAKPTRALWITGEPTSAALRNDFSSITFLERVVVLFHDKPFREYTVYLCENKPPR